MKTMNYCQHEESTYALLVRSSEEERSLPETAVYVLHAFQKKTQRTVNTDIELAKVRYRMIGGTS